jgi:hypothetical protein
MYKIIIALEAIVLVFTASLTIMFFKDKNAELQAETSRQQRHIVIIHKEKSALEVALKESSTETTPLNGVVSGDKTLLWNSGRVVKMIEDERQHYDAIVNGQALRSPKRIISGHGVFVTQYQNVTLPNGRDVRCAINLVVVAPQGATIMKNRDVWELREWGIEQNAYYRYLSPNDIWEREATDASDRNDRVYFSLYVASPGEQLDPKVVADRLLAEGKFYTLSEGLPQQLTQYVAVAAK